MKHHRLGWIAASVISFGLGIAVASTTAQSSALDTSHYGAVNAANCAHAGSTGQAACYGNASTDGARCGR